MFKNVRKAWAEFFRGCFTIPLKTAIKHPVCLVVAQLICLLPFAVLIGEEVYENKKLEKDIARWNDMNKAIDISKNEA